MIRKFFVILVLVGGLVACNAFRLNQPPDAPAMVTHVQIAVLVAALIAAMVPGIARRLVHALERVRHPGPRGRAMFAVGMAGVSIVYFIFAALRQHRELYPRFHDDQMYLLQMRLMSTLRLWTKSPALPDFFDSFHILVKPVYASIYFPGTALLYVAQLWLHAPIWFGPVIVAGAIVGLTFRIASELLDDAVLGFAAAMLVVGVTWFRYLSMVIMSHSVVMFLGLLMMWAYLRWRRRPTLGGTALIGALAGWAAITRPVDAICYAAPVAIAMLWHLARHERKRLVSMITVGVVAAIPFLSLQLILDKGVTGHFLKTPYQFYAEMYAPNLAYGTHAYNPTAVPQTVVLQKKVYDEYFNKAAAADAAKNSPVNSWLEWKLHKLMAFGLASGLLIVLIPLAFFDVERRERWLLFAVFPFYLIGYAFFSFLLPHYCVVVSPALAMGAVMAVDVLRRTFPRARMQLDVFFTIALVGLAVTSLSEFTGRADDYLKTPTMKIVAVDLPKMVRAPAVVLFQYIGHRENGHLVYDDYTEEPVYNLDTVNIDDAPIIRAHDLGPERNLEIVDYYARRQPERMFYLFDRHTRELQPLGTARELAEKFPLSAPASRPSSSPAS